MSENNVNQDGTPSSSNQSGLAAFNLGDWLVEPSLNRISNNQGSVQISPRNMKVLCFLASGDGTVVSRVDLLEKIWSGVVVGEEVLTGAISELRQTLNDDTRKPRYIETIRKGGYRLIVPVVPVGESNENTPSDSSTLELSPTTNNSTGFSKPKRLWLLLLLPFLVLGFSFINRSETEMETEDFWRTVPLTSLVGQERHPALSPDGSRVAYVRREFGKDESQLYLRQCGTNNEILLYEDKFQFLYTNWSVDGSTIAFIASHTDKEVLKIIPSLGGVVRDMAVFEGYCRGLDWSPDGRKIVVSLEEAEKLPSLSFLDLETKQFDPLFPTGRTGNRDVLPAYSPDGQTLAFVRSGKQAIQDIYTLDLGDENAEPRRITRKLASFSSLDWLPDGKTLVATAQTNDRRQLWRIDLASGEMLLQELGQRHVIQTSAAANGPGLVLSGLNLNYDVAEIDIQQLQAAPTGYQPKSVLSSTWLDYQPRVSPVTGQVAFISDRRGELQIYLTDGEGETARPVTNSNKGRIWNLRWSADEKFLCYTMNYEQVPAYFSLDIASNTTTRLPISIDGYQILEFSKNGNWIYVNYNEGDAWKFARIDLDGTNRQEILPYPIELIWENVSDNTLYYYKPGQSQVYYQRPGLSESEQTLPFDLPGKLLFTSDGKHIYALSSIAEKNTLFRWNLATEELEELGQFQGRIAGSISVSHDGTRILTTIETHRDLDLLLIPDFQ